ncbi:MAG: cupin domain-containing protein [Planctomycetes bacterium]|nr:cupin domain-containing protein [Planctomycetota bacterium]
MNLTRLVLDVRDAGVPWRETRFPGVSWWPLHFDPAAGPESPATVLIRMEPGRGYPAHEHLDVEDVLVLQGGYADEFGDHRAGAYVRYPAGSRHAPVALGEPDRRPDAAHLPCILFAVARGGVRQLEGPSASVRSRP